MACNQWSKDSWGAACYLLPTKVVKMKVLHHRFILLSWPQLVSHFLGEFLIHLICSLVEWQPLSSLSLWNTATSWVTCSVQRSLQVYKWQSYGQKKTQLFSLGPFYVGLLFFRFFCSGEFWNILRHHKTEWSRIQKCVDRNQVAAISCSLDLTVAMTVSHML